MRDHSVLLEGLPTSVVEVTKSEQREEVFAPGPAGTSQDLDDGDDRRAASVLQDDLTDWRTAPNSKLLVTVPEAGRVLAISRSKVYELMDAGHLPSVCIGRSRRIRMSDLRTFVESGERQ